MALTLAQVNVARILVRSAIKGALEIENNLDELLEKREGNVTGINQELEALGQIIKSAMGSLADIPAAEPKKEEPKQDEPEIARLDRPMPPMP